MGRHVPKPRCDLGTVQVAPLVRAPALAPVNDDGLSHDGIPPSRGSRDRIARASASTAATVTEDALFLIMKVLSQFEWW